MGGRRKFWARLEPELQWILVQAGSRRFYGEGEVLMRDGDQGTWFAVLTFGIVKVVGHGANGTTVIAHRYKDDVIGELAVAGSKVRMATVSAITKVGTLRIEADRLRRIGEQHPPILWAMLAVLADRATESDEYRIEADTAPLVRAARALVRRLERDGHPTAAGMTVDICSQEEFGAIAGTSRATVGRLLQSLRVNGVLTTSRGQITVHDVAALRHAAELTR
ncbi:Crp/Fnr family transcriptional regulator [Actinocrispum wychmicini]|uniref:Crp/Fnr family transcriptional regulator n=1 Tax=Actinocrispum wychmicini TaxID=1213861 RepID=UPI001404ADA2|nr:Crp/Fnr family transcriptional regulator [Actinocrispum wychmicini]